MASSVCTWRALACNIKELRLDITLACGQSFRWKETAPGEWTSVLRGWIWTLKQEDQNVLYKVHQPEQCSTIKKLAAEEKSKPSKTTKSLSKRQKRPHVDIEKGVVQAGSSGGIAAIKQETNDLNSGGDCNTDVLYETILRDYFQLQYNLEDLYTQWSAADDNFRDVSNTFTGVRMLRQDPTENVFSFICSSNNHISRISGMVERLCENYGKRIGEVNGHVYHAFPAPEALAGDAVESKLRELGFGYRAKFINKSAQTICERGGESWLLSLRNKPYEEAKAELMSLCGVGAKVADCICLMSLDHLGAIPVDTHVWQIAARHYMTKLNSAKSLTPTIYNQIGDHFRGIWGELAGWAHSVLFSADLKKFQDLKNKGSKVKQEKANEKIYKETNLKKDVQTKVKLENPEGSPQKRAKIEAKPKGGKRKLRKK